MRGGLWFARTVHEIPLDDLDEIVETKKLVHDQRNDNIWTFHYHSRQPQELHLSDLLDANRSPAIEYLRRQGFRIGRDR
jgi:hypothetical protein